MSESPDRPDAHASLDFCLRVGELLLSSGAGAADVVATMRALGDRFGLARPEVDVTFISVSMGVQADADQPAVLMVRHVTRRRVDYADLTAVDHLVKQVLAGELDLPQARNRLARIVSSPRARQRWAVTAGWGVMSSGVALLLGGGPAVIVIAFVSGACIDRVQLSMNRRRLPLFYQQVAGGIIATLFAVLAPQVGISIDPSRAVTANIVMLLAGIGLMGAVQDALTGFSLTAGARFTEALLATAGIIAGVGGGLSLGKILGSDVARLELKTPQLSHLLLIAAGSAICAAGFGYATYAPLRTLAPVALVAAFAASAERAATVQGLTQAWSTALAALLVGLLSYPLAKGSRVPPLVIVVPAIVPMLPGLSIYRGLALLNEGGARASEGLLSMVTAGSIALGLASGVILGGYLAQPLAREARKVESRLAGPRLVGPLTLRVSPHRRHRQDGP